MIKKDDVIYFVGIKGTGMTALAELYKSFGAIVTGSDTPEQFYTDEILKELAIPVFEEFNQDNVPKETKLLVHSAAYDPESHPEILRAKSLGVRIISYPKALGEFSKSYISAGISGVHGKTTTTAIAGTLIKELNLPCTVLTGSAAANFSNRSTFINGDKYFISETCEYKRNFLNYEPKFLIITSIEPDHLDYFKDYNDILHAFVEYGEKIIYGGTLIFCSDDKGASKAASLIKEKRPDIEMIPYGQTATGDYKITILENTSGEQHFSLRKYESQIFTLKVSGRHNVLNSAAAMALVNTIVKSENNISIDKFIVKKMNDGLRKFRGTKRRCEIIGEADGILFIDDYGHHPSAIKTTLKGLRDFYPNRRIIVDFMSHTYSRTAALIDDFAQCFESADIVSLHKIYASAREKTGKITGEELYRRVKKNHEYVFYYEEIMDAYEAVEKIIKFGDVFVTMGAGDNWKLGYKLYKDICEKRGLLE